MAKSHRIILVRLTLALLIVLSVGTKAQEIRRAIPVNPSVARTPAPLVPTSVPTPVPGVVNNVSGLVAPINDTANFLAGLPVPADSPLVPLAQDPAWQRHASFFNQAWTKLDANQLTGIRNWEASFLPDAAQPIPTAFYMFAGPDFLYAHQFFPNARPYILAGTEPIGPLPDVLRFAGPALAQVLQNLEKSLNSVLSFSFFITKDMKTDL